MKRGTLANKVALLGIFGALALVLAFLEQTLLPDLPLLPPGAKLGLSNLVTMLAASLFGFPYAMAITALKGLFAFLTRGAVAASLSLSGGVLSTIGMCLMLKKEGRWFSPFGIGVVSAVLHNLGQLLVSCFLTGTASLLYYGKYLLLFAMLTGALTGLMLSLLLPRLRRIERLHP